MSATKMLFWCLFVIVTFMILLFLLLTKEEQLIFKSTKPPHILFLLVDDWGWANVGYHQNPLLPEVVTPNMDRLKEQGLELDQHYVFHICSPSRSSFLSGRLPIHANDRNIPGHSYNPKDPVSGFAGIPRKMTTIGTKLKQAGYKTHLVGKWHAGSATPDHIPTGRGFDTSFGYLEGTNDYYTQLYHMMCNNKLFTDLWENDHPAFKETGTGYEEALFKEHAIDLIDNHDPNEPLFLFYSSHIAHGPLQVPERYLNKFKFIDQKNRRVYNAMVNYLDDIVGELTKALKNRGLWDNLLFIVSGDNGGIVLEKGGANNYPLRGGKGSNWQGGVRTPAFVTGGYLPKQMVGKKTEEYIHIADWYSTFCALAGVDPTDEVAKNVNLPPIDSLNMWPLISGQNDTSPRKEIALSMQSFISGPYKIITGDAKFAGWAGPVYPNTTTTPGLLNFLEHCGEDGCLYNIMADPEERVNLASILPEKLKELQDKLNDAQKTYFNPNRGLPSPEACRLFEEKYKGYWGPFLP